MGSMATSLYNSNCIIQIRINVGVKIEVCDWNDMIPIPQGESG